MDASNKVNFCVIGAQKCGTTNLAEHLLSHPDIGFCKEKEPDFFSKLFDKSSGFDAYHNLFDFDLNKSMYGEASTSYSFVDEYPKTAERLFNYNPDMKILFIVRDPVSRVESHFNHRLRKGYILGDDPVKNVSAEDDFIQRSQYVRQLEPYLKLFPAEQVKVLVFEEFLSDQSAAMRDVVNFLGLDPDKLPELELSPKNISDAKVRLKKSTIALRIIEWLEKQSWSWRLAKWIPIRKKLPLEYKALLYSMMRKDITDFEAFIGREIPSWHKWNSRKLEIPHVFAPCDNMSESNTK
ncbi:MAG: hypothetical protein CL840_04820 [Crocinitomicaceae bacterium]|nr:hypothetical protein [Crocinitomicaceae bacterium]|tara:strand:+ start:10147 stop:11031 length:885 start_codon:yes stop_codon:yes gene_type:complete